MNDFDRFGPVQRPTCRLNRYHLSADKLDLLRKEHQRRPGSAMSTLVHVERPPAGIHQPLQPVPVRGVDRAPAPGYSSDRRSMHWKKWRGGAA